MFTLKQKILVLGLIILILIVIIILLWLGISKSVFKIEYLGNDIPLYSLCSHKSKRCDQPAGSHSCCIDHLATMLEALTEELGSKVFILYGTALAHKRYNGKYMIPHDDDLDTGILVEDEELLKAAIPKLEEKGFVVHLKHNNDKVRGAVNAWWDVGENPPYRYYCIEYSKDNKLHLDISLLITSHFKDGTSVLVDAPQKWANTVSTMSTEEARKYKPWIYPKNFVLPVKKAKYLGVNTYHPAKIEQYLKYIYGPEYMTPYDLNNNKNNNKNNTTVSRLIKQMPNSDNKSIGMGAILIINLDNDKERLHHLFKQCEEEGLYAKKIGNCCTRPLTGGENNRFVFNNRRFKTLSTAEKKTFLSHEMCWKEAAKQSLPSLIVEDDVAFPFEFKDILSRITNELKYMIKFGMIPKATTIRLGCTTDWTNNIQQIEDTCFATGELNTGGWAYIVTPEAAKELLTFSLNNSLLWPPDHVFNPPYNRKSSQRYETKIPGIDIYMFLEIYEGAFSSLRKRYNLKTDKGRNQIVQELSTELKSSRSQIKD